MGIDRLTVVFQGIQILYVIKDDLWPSPEALTPLRPCAAINDQSMILNDQFLMFFNMLQR